MWREKANRASFRLISRIFKRQKIPEGEVKAAEMSGLDISAVIPVVVIEPTVVPERFKVEKEPEKQEGKVDKESIAMRFTTDLSELDKAKDILNMQNK